MSYLNNSKASEWILLVELGTWNQPNITWHKDQEHLPTVSDFYFPFPIQMPDVGKVDLKDTHIVQHL